MDKDNQKQFDEENIDWDDFFREDDDEWEKEKERLKKKKSLIVKIVGSLIALSLVITGLQVWFNIVNIPSLRFLNISQQLSSQPEINELKEAIVTIEWDNKKGTGFNIQENGLIVTNEHVVNNTNYVNIYFKERGAYIGKVILTNEELDLAIVEIDGENLPSLPLSKEPNIDNWLNEEIIFIGNPLAYTQIVNEGTIIDVKNLYGGENEVLIMDAPVYQGNSGSPVLNSNGEVIGVIYATYTSDQYEKRVGLATPAYYIWDMLQDNK